MDESLKYQVALVAFITSDLVYDEFKLAFLLAFKKFVWNGICDDISRIVLSTVSFNFQTHISQINFGSWKTVLKMRYPHYV